MAGQASLSAEVKILIKQQLEDVANGWTVYRIARQASRMVSCGCEAVYSHVRGDGTVILHLFLITSSFVALCPVIQTVLWCKPL